MAYQPDFPFVNGGQRGYFKLSQEDLTIKGRIIQLMYTNSGERPFLCGFGVGLPKMLFEPLDVTSVDSLRSKIYEQTSIYEPSLAVRQLDVTVTDYGPPATIKIFMEVENKKNQTRQRLFFDTSE
jgi:phage baseplate assembly protein W